MSKMPIKEYKVFLSRVRSLFADIGPAIERSAHIEKRYKRNTADTDPDSFCVLFNLPRYEITHRFGTGLIGYPHLDIETWIRDVIHPYYRAIYLEFGFVAYELALNMRDQIKDVKFALQFEIPVYSKKDNAYVWLSQFIEPCDFDAQGQIHSHLVLYRRTGIYKDSEYRMFQPVVYFDEHRVLEIENQIRDMVQVKMFNIFFKDLNLAPKKNILEYWKLVNEPDPITASVLSKIFGITTKAVEKRNAVITNFIKDSDLPFKVSEAKELGDILFALLGPCQISL